MTSNGRGPHPLRDNSGRARGFTLADYRAELAAGGGPSAPASHSTPPPPPPPQQHRAPSAATGSRASSALPPLSASGSRAPDRAPVTSSAAPAAAAGQQAFGGGTYYGQSAYGAPQAGYGTGYPAYGEGVGSQPYNAAPGPSSYPAAAGGAGKKRKKRDRWAGPAIPPANATAGGGGSYSSDDDDDDEVDMMTVPSATSARASSAALREFTPALLDPTGGRAPPAGAPANWGKSAKKRLRLKGNVDFGKRPSKGRLDQRRPSTSDDSDDDGGDDRPYRPYEPSDSDDEDGHPLGPRIAMPAAVPPPPVDAPPPLPPSPPPAPPPQLVEVAPASAARPGARELGLAKLERLRQEKKAAREREALELARREAEAAAGPSPPPPPPPPLPPQQASREPSVDEWGQQGWATPQPSIPAADPRPLRLDQDAARRFVGHHAPAQRAAPEPWQSQGERAWRTAQTSTTPVIKAEPGTGDQEIPPPPTARPSAAHAAPPTAPGPAPVEPPDVKPDVRRRRSSSPAAPPPPRPKQGVTSWSAAQLPPDCNFPPNLKHPTAEDERRRTQARNRFKLKVRWELQNERKKVTRLKWIAGELAADWQLDTRAGTWTAVFPDDVQTEAERQRFLDDQVAVVEARGWEVLASGWEKRSDGHPLGVSISWVNDHPTPSPSPEPVVPPLPAAPPSRVKPEPVDPTGPTTFGADLSGALSSSVELMASLAAVDRAPTDLAAIDRSRRLYATFLSHVAGAQARAERRLDRLSDRIQSQQSTQAGRQ